jgi:hypothetical protein
MDTSKQDLIEAWLKKAKHDLAAAKKIASGDTTYLDTAMYHCQQAAEKAIKAFLTAYDVRFDKTHDIRLLGSVVTRWRFCRASVIPAQAGIQGLFPTSIAWIPACAGMTRGATNRY